MPACEHTAFGTGTREQKMTYKNVSKPYTGLWKCLMHTMMNATGTIMDLVFHVYTDRSLNG